MEKIAGYSILASNLSEHQFSLPPAIVIRIVVKGETYNFELSSVSCPFSFSK